MSSRQGEQQVGRADRSEATKEVTDRRSSRQEMQQAGGAAGRRCIKQLQAEKAAGSKEQQPVRSSKIVAGKQRLGEAVCIRRTEVAIRKQKLEAADGSSSKQERKRASERARSGRSCFSQEKQAGAV